MTRSMPFALLLALPAVAEAQPGPPSAAAQRPARAPVHAGLPAVSPDGRWIAYVGFPDTANPRNSELYVIPIGGGAARRLTDSPDGENTPLFTGDGRRLVTQTMAMERGQMIRRAWFVDVATGARTPIRDTAQTASPALSPDGTRLLYSVGTFPNLQLAVADADGRNERVIVTQPGVNFWGRWSPDGQRIAFTWLEPRQGGQLGIWLVNADGTDLRRLTDSTLRAETPAWAPDGRRLAFQSQVNGNSDIYTIRSDGSGLTRITTAPSVDETPAFTPDGRQIVFQSDRSGAMELWIMQADGTSPRQLTR